MEQSFLSQWQCVRFVYIFFQNLVCGDVESLQLSSETMTAVKDLLQNLEFEMNTNNETAKEVIEKMRGIAEKLKMPFDLASLQREFYSTKMINSVSIVNFTLTQGSKSEKNSAILMIIFNMCKIIYSSKAIKSFKTFGEFPNCTFLNFKTLCMHYLENDI